MIQVYPLRVSKGLFINYTYLVVDKTSREAILIDPGWEFDTIIDCLLKTKSDLKAVLLTHHHADHTQLASDFARAFDVPVLMSRVERDFYNFKCLNLKPIPPDQLFYVGNFEIFPYLTPGHTKGGVCFQIENHLFTGDTLFVEGCGMCAGAGADAGDMYNSLKKLKINIEPQVRIYPGHSFGIAPGVTFHYLLTQNIYFHFKESAMFVAFRMRKHQTGLFNFK